VEEGDTVEFGEIALKVLHTPGHSPGGIALHTDGVVFVGDTLFAGSIGRTDLPGGDYNTLIQSVRTKLFPLGDEVKVFCGHGPATTFGREKQYNPFFR
jgi:glyoxylase-like metal-dependent hydrolase (beta-lactamase superfamily II)